MRSPSTSLAGQKVVVVGGKTGIGLGVAQAAPAAGATVVVASRRLSSPQERPDLAGFQQVSLDIRTSRLSERRSAPSARSTTWSSPPRPISAPGARSWMRT